MTDKRFPCKTKHMGITTVLMTVVMLLLFSVACSGDKKEVVAVEYDPETTYGMKTTDVYSLVSDSGLVRYRLVAKEWYVFDKAAEPYSYFPEGFYVEKFDTLFQAEGFIKGDTAYNWDKKKLWKLIGNVEIVTLKGDSVQTSLLYWDEKEEKIYTDQYFRRALANGDVMTGIGFDASQDMQDFVVQQATGEFVINDTGESSESTSSSDSIAVTDSPQRKPARSRPAPPPHNPIMLGPKREVSIPDTLQLELKEETNRLIENETGLIEEIITSVADSLQIAE